jgi:methylmalonyl-CoA/ethylmalonyl-CoA epimerase
MRLHHLGFVGHDLATMQRRFRKESAAELTAPIDDPIQRVVVQFYRDRTTGEVWEIIAPLGTLEGSPLAGRVSRGGGLDHVCYELDAADGTLEDVLAAERAGGAHIACPPVPSTAFVGRRIAFVVRRSGRVVEYVEERAAGAVV